MPQDTAMRQYPTLKELIERIRTDPLLLRSADFPVPHEINAGTIELFEAGLGVGTNYTLLYPVGPVDFNIRRVALRLDQVFNTDARQVEVLARTLHTLAEGPLRAKTATSRRRLYLDIVLHALDQLPMGKAFRDEWLQRDAQGLPLLHWLDVCRTSVNELSQRHPPSAPLRQSLDDQMRKMERQLEAGFEINECLSVRSSPRPHDMSDDIL